MIYLIARESLKAAQDVIQTSEVTSPMPLAFNLPGKLLKEIHRMDAQLNTTLEQQTTTESPESIHKVPQTVGVPPTMPLVVTPPGKLQNILKIT